MHTACNGCGKHFQVVSRSTIELALKQVQTEIQSINSTPVIEWGASANDVAATSGTPSGLLSAPGCMVGRYLCDRMDRKLAYALFGIPPALCAVLMAWAPHHLTMYYTFVLSYGFSGGLYSDAGMGIPGVPVFLPLSVVSKSLHQHYLERRSRA